MASTAMLPGKLTPEVIVLILSYLDDPSLFSLLLTSKQLHPYAAKILYSQKWPHRRVVKIEESIYLNPENAKYLTEYHCTNILHFTALLARGPLHLDRFILVFPKQQLRIREKMEFAEACKAIIAAVHADTTIREVDLSRTNPVLLCPHGRPAEFDGDWDIGGDFLSKLTSFGGIERVVLRPFFCSGSLGLGSGREDTYKTTQQVFDELSSLSTLKHITFIDAEIIPEDWNLTFAEGTLPSLKSIQFHYTMPEAPAEITKENLEYLRRYQKRGVFFEVTAYSYSKPYITFYLPAIKHYKEQDSQDDEERRSLIRWLVRGEQYFQLNEHALDIFMLDLISYRPAERDLILTTIQSEEFVKPFALRLMIYAEDSNMTSSAPDLDSNAKLFANLLPRQLSYLELCVRGALEIGFIPLLIPALKHLNRLVIDTFTKVPKVVAKQTQKGSQTIILDGQGTFTQAPYSVKVLSSDISRPVIWSLELEKQEDPLWTFWVRKEDGSDVEGVIYEETKEYVEVENRDIEKEMSGWFELSDSLKTINLRVLAGRAWFLDAWKPYFEYDS